MPTNDDFFNYALILPGFRLKCFDINPFYAILAIIVTPFCAFHDDAIVNNLDPTESDN